MKAKWLSIFAIVAILVIAVVPVAAAPKASGGMTDDALYVPREDNRPDPYTAVCPQGQCDL